MVDVFGGIDRPDRGQAELVLQQHERDQRTEVGPRGQVSLPVALAACRGVDQAAEPGGGGVDELDEPGVTSQRVPPMRMVTRSRLARVVCTNNQVSSFRAPVERAVALKTWRIPFTDLLSEYLEITKISIETRTPIPAALCALGLHGPPGN